MIAIRTILVPVDFSEPSKKALSYGLSLASEFKARLIATHIVEYSKPLAYAFPSATFEIEKHQIEEVRTKLKDLIPEDARERLTCHFVVKAGVAEDELLAAIKDEPADLVVMGTHGRRGFERWLLGSVTEHMLRKVSAPILTVSRLENENEERAWLSQGRILCATDFSEGSDKAIEFAHELAKRFSAKLTVMHVLSPLRWEYGTKYLPLDLVKDHEKLHQDLEKQLEESIPEAVRSDTSVHWELGEGVPSEVLLEQVDQRDIDLLVTCLHGKTRAERARLGSTAERIVRGAHRPVLSIPVV